MASASFTSYLTQLENLLEEYLVKKAPSLPKNIKEFIVKFAPWITIVIMLFAIPAVLLVLGLGALVAPFTVFLGPGYAVGYGVGYVVSMVVLALSIVLEAMAIPGLFARSKKGWQLVFYATLVGFVSNLVGFQIVSGLIGALIGLYLLFQVREYYK